MIETEQRVTVAVPIGEAWTFVRDIERWAHLMPGLQQFEVIDADRSHWTLKVGAGGMVRTVRVEVQVDRWAPPGEVDFSYSLAGDPVKGGGTYRAAAPSPGETEIALNVRVEGSGPLAPMWEALGKPLLPRFTRGFAEQLRVRIEESTEGGTAVSEANKEVVLRFIHAMGSNDPDTAAACLAPDAFTLAKGFSKFTGVRHFDTIVETIGSFREVVPTGLRPKILSVTAEADRVVVEFEGNAECSNGAPYCNEYCMVFRLEDGLIKQVNEYFCTILAETVLWPLAEEWMRKRAAASGRAG